MRRAHVIVALCGFLVLAPASWSKGATIGIEIDGDGSSAPIVITDRRILDQFNIWNGPGVQTTGPDGVPKSTSLSRPRSVGGSVR
jgi:hypothetical protein